MVVDECSAMTSAFGTAGAVMDVAAMELREHGAKDLSLAYAKRALQWYREKAAGRGAGEEESTGLAEALYDAEQWEEARSIFRELSQKHPEDIDHLGYLGALAARLGDREEALLSSDRLKAVERPFLFGAPSYWRACIASILGEREQAVSLLRDAFAQGYPYGVSVLSDMNLERLRGYGPFKELIEPKA